MGAQLEGKTKDGIDVEKWYKNRLNLVFVALGILFLTAVGFAYRAYVFYDNTSGIPSESQCISREQLGQIGDFFGGILNPSLTFLTFVAILITIIVQLLELRDTRKEITATSESNRIQADALVEQNKGIIRNLTIQKADSLDRIFNEPSYSAGIKHRQNGKLIDIILELEGDKKIVDIIDGSYGNGKNLRYFTRSLLLFFTECGRLRSLKQLDETLFLALTAAEIRMIIDRMISVDSDQYQRILNFGVPEGKEIAGSDDDYKNYFLPFLQWLKCSL